VSISLEDDCAMDDEVEEAADESVTEESDTEAVAAAD